mmetsp:Transcript_25182/g.30735  ORF Transcript_25182/g.30735 Transcript_25182/m.30735 type:complete len:101 (-) Transcript_25182:682-984(-)
MGIQYPARANLYLKKNQDCASFDSGSFSQNENMQKHIAKTPTIKITTANKTLKANHAYTKVISGSVDERKKSDNAYAMNIPAITKVAAPKKTCALQISSR